MEFQRHNRLWPGYSDAALQFLNRTNGVSRRDADLYAALIDGLVSDAVWPLLDVLYIFAVTDPTTALVNLKQSSFAGVANGAPAFSAYGGYTGIDASGTVYIDTGLNPSGFSGNYGTDNKHLSVWSNTNAVSSANGGACIGNFDTVTHFIDGLYPLYSDNNTYYYQRGSVSVANANGTGHYISNRGASNSLTGYKNGISVATGSQLNATINNNIFVLALGETSGAAAIAGSANQICAASIGGDLSGGSNALNFYSRLRVFMTAVGVP